MGFIVRLIILIMLMIPTVTITPITINQKNFGVYDSTGDKIVILALDESDKYNIFIKDINTGVETQITTDGKRKDNPVMTGDFIAWKQRAVNSKLVEVVLFNLEDSTLKTLSDAPIDGTGKLVLTDKWLVWFESNRSSNNLCAYDLLTGSKFSIYKEVDFYVSDIVILDNIIHYFVSRICSNDRSNYEIYSYNLVMKKETIICNVKSTKYFLVGKGDWLAWTDTRNGKSYELYLYQVSKGKEYLIDNPDYKPSTLVIGSGYVVYSSNKGKSPGPLYKLSLAGDLKPKVLLSGKSFRTYLQESDDIIMWDDSGLDLNNPHKIYGILASGGIPFEISNSDKTQYLIMNKNNIVVWFEYKSRYDRIEKVCKITIDKK